MQHFRSLDEVQLSSSWVTIGTFDGVHLGHQQIIKDLVQKARKQDQTPVVVTFHPHPAVVLGGVEGPYYLTLPEKRAQLLADLGVEIVITHPFTRRISNYSPEKFIARLDEHLHLEKLWVGYDFALGKDRAGDARVLNKLGETFGYQLEVIPPYKLAGKKVSSSTIRTMLREGHVVEAARFLGRSFSLQGEVVIGDKRGHSLGFPTSNLEVPEEMIDIQPGVYAGWAAVDGNSWPAVTNVGFRPTFEVDFPPLRIETHLLDFSGNLYDKQLEVSFQVKLRDERKFAQVDDLIAQIGRDVNQARRILTKEDQKPDFSLKTH